MQIKFHQSLPLFQMLKYNNITSTQHLYSVHKITQKKKKKKVKVQRMHVASTLTLTSSSSSPSHLLILAIIVGFFAISAEDGSSANVSVETKRHE